LARYENVQELLNSIKEFVDDPIRTGVITEEGEIIERNPDIAGSENPPLGGGGASLGAYLQQIVLLTDADEEKGNDDVVKLMTIHAAKGLEFPVVFVGGLEETLFPNAMSINTREELEEERRLFYVAITRAKSRLWLSYANARYRFGQLQQNDPSRFLEEIPEEYVDKSYAGGATTGNGWNRGGIAGNTPRNFGGSAWNAAQRAEKQYGAPPAHRAPGAKKTAESFYTKPVPSTPRATGKSVEHTPSENFEASDTSNLQVGNKVEHLKFGYGEVLKMEGAAHNPIATVQFELNGEKKIMLNYAKLRIVE
jgi:DNA helicase II / ATP-dependent DNA helicase PcrA